MCYQMHGTPRDTQSEPPLPPRVPSLSPVSCPIWNKVLFASLFPQLVLQTLPLSRSPSCFSAVPLILVPFSSCPFSLLRGRLCTTCLSPGCEAPALRGRPSPGCWLCRIKIPIRGTRSLPACPWVTSADVPSDHRDRLARLTTGVGWRPDEARLALRWPTWGPLESPPQMALISLCLAGRRAAWPGQSLITAHFKTDPQKRRGAALLKEKDGTALPPPSTAAGPL